jgi:hypothetical protein
MNPQSRPRLLWLLCCSLISSAVFSCASPDSLRTPALVQVANTPPEKAAVNATPVIHVFVALADNVNQGIVPVSATLGNGDNAATNLYWGATFGIKTFFSRNKDWELISITRNPGDTILERCMALPQKSSLRHSAVLRASAVMTAVSL